MRFSIVFLISIGILYLIPGTFQQCIVYDSCANCTANPNCGWVKKKQNQCLQ